MEGTLTLASDPSAPLDAASKQYVDSRARGEGGQYDYKWSTSTTMADPGHGWARANNGTPASATHLALSLFDEGGTARIGLLQLVAGDTVGIYEAGAIADWVTYTVSATPTNNANSWLDVPVVLKNSGGTFDPSNNTPVIIAVRANTVDTGTIILDGPAPPTEAIGDPGDYYEDTLNGVFYGPKAATGGVANSILSEPFNDFTSAPWALNGTPTITTGRTGTGATMTGAFSRADYSIS